MSKNVFIGLILWHNANAKNVPGTEQALNKSLLNLNLEVTGANPLKHKPHVHAATMFPNNPFSL